MKRLWKVIPPCLSDILGFEAVLNETEGFGIIDDPSRYKPIRMGQKAGFHAVPGDGGMGRNEWKERRQKDYEYERKPDGHFQREAGGFGRAAGMRGVRVVNSDIRNEDIITGTENKVMQAFRRGQEQYSPDFVLLCCAPSSSMINSDLEYAAEKISGLSGLPAAEVKIAGEKDYLYGVGMTLEAMGKLLLKARKTVPGTINILGANTIDWTNETSASTEEIFTDAGWKVLSRWGIKETTQNLQKAAGARVNVVVSEAGLRLARYMESEFGIPYVAGAPFGKEAAKDLLDELSACQTRGESDGTVSDERKSADMPCLKREAVEPGRGKMESYEQMMEAPEILIVAEQFIANAVRRTLLSHGLCSIRVLSFYDMDRAFMLPGDKKLTDEEDFEVQANCDSVRMIIADPDEKPLVKKEIRYIDFPNGGSFSPVNATENFNMAGELLDHWLMEKGCFQ